MPQEHEATRIEFSDEHLTHLLMDVAKYIDDNFIMPVVIRELNLYNDFETQMWIANLFIDTPDFETETIEKSEDVASIKQDSIIRQTNE